MPPRADHAGAAYMELQMYPPGFAPAISCDDTHWCAALTIDSLQANFGGLHGPGSPPDQSRGSRPIYRGSKKPTTAAGWPVITTLERAAPTHRPVRSTPGATCSVHPREHAAHGH